MTLTKLYPEIAFYSEDVPNTYTTFSLDSWYGIEGTLTMAFKNKSTNTIEMALYLNNKDKSLYVGNNEINYKIATE